MRGGLTSRHWHLALKGGLAAFLAMGLYAALPEPARRSEEAFYLLYGIARSVLPSEAASRQAFRERITGTLYGGVVVGLLRLVMAGWPAVAVGYVLVQAGGNRLRLTPGTRTNAITMAFLLMLIPGYGSQNFLYSFHRVLWHLLGLSIGSLVERLFWPEDPQAERRKLERRLVELLGPLGADEAPAFGRPQVQELVELFRSYRQLSTAAVAGGGEGGESEAGARTRLLEQAVVHGVARARVNLLPWQDPRGQQQLQSLDQRRVRQALEALAALDARPPQRREHADGP